MRNDSDLLSAQTDRSCSRQPVDWTGLALPSTRPTHRRLYVAFPWTSCSHITVVSHCMSCLWCTEIWQLQYIRIQMKCDCEQSCTRLPDNAVIDRVHVRYTSCTFVAQHTLWLSFECEHRRYRHLLMYLWLDDSDNESMTDTVAVGIWAASSTQCMLPTLIGMNSHVNIDSWICNDDKLTSNTPTVLLQLYSRFNVRFS